MWNHIRLIQYVKSKIPLWLKLILIKWLVNGQAFYFSLFPRKISGLAINKGKIFLLLSTDYSNLGDHAMTFAHLRLLKNNFPEHEVVEVLVSDTLKYLKFIAGIIRPGDVITLKGGGNIGLEYFREELFRRIILTKFRHNRIILFPQTVYFPDTKTGNREFAKTIAIFNSHPDFHLITRDRPSFEILKNHVDSWRLYLTPDIVLSLGNLRMTNKRSGVTICLRDDKEGIYTQTQKDLVIRAATSFYTKVNITDTVKEYAIKTNQRVLELNKIWNMFSASELVITDRLHGMIFAAITSTPCIVLGTYNHKLIGAYNWIKYLNYIKFVQCEAAAIEEAILDLRQTKVKPYDGELYKKYMSQIVALIKTSHVKLSCGASNKSVGVLMS